MLHTKSVPLFAVAFLTLLPGIAGAASVDIRSGGSRVVIDRDGQVFIRNGNRERDFYSDSNFDDDLDRVIPPLNPRLGGLYRPRSNRDRYNRGRCKEYSHSYSRGGSSSYSSSVVCH
jgi:hypothetical protein